MTTTVGTLLDDVHARAWDLCSQLGDHVAGDPAESVTDAVALLARASRKAADLGQLLEDAQAALSDQGYRTDDHPSLFDDGDPR